MRSRHTGNQHSFAEVASANIPRSKFDRSHGKKTTFSSGLLIPVYADEALPGDTFSMRMTAFARLGTPLTPTMDNLYLESFFFAVPNRLIWDNWQKFNGEQVDPGDSTDFTVPQIVCPGGTAEEDSLADYLGIPVQATDLTVNSLHFRAYNLIYNEFFRDQNLIDSEVVDRDDGPDTYADYAIKRRGKRHDYFSSSLPWPQKGDAVSLPLGTSAPVITTIDAAQVTTIDPTTSGIPTFDGGGHNATTLQGVSPNPEVRFTDGNASTTEALKFIDPALEVDIGGLTATGTADLSTATAATVNELRQAVQIQRLYERDARGGSRYTEIVRSHFGVVSPDQRLQRPEYLGGGSQQISFTPVPINSGASGGIIGELAAFAVSAGSSHTFHKSFTEHCVLIGLVCVRADLNYQQGLNRMWSRQTRWDFYWPELAHLGEQAVLNKEIYAQGTDDLVADAAVWGYQERFGEYRYKPSEISGQFRSGVTASLDLWHLAQDFSALPTLGETFIEETPPIARIVATPTLPDFLLDTAFDLKCVRPMPMFGTPGNMDRF